MVPPGRYLIEDSLETAYSLSRVRKILGKVYPEVYRTPDSHSHIGWRTMKEYLDFQCERILDVGCGAGLTTFEIAQPLHNNGWIIGTDMDERAIRVANRISRGKSLKQVEFKVGNITGLDFRDETFNEISCCVTLRCAEAVKDLHQRGLRFAEADGSDEKGWLKK